MALVALVCWPAVAADLALAGETLAITVGGAAGQLTGVADSTGRRYVTRGEDRYHLEGKTSTEADDTVTTATPGQTTLLLECENRRLGLKLKKEYRLTGRIVEKRVTYTAATAEPTLLRLSSQTVVEPSLYRTGYYYVATDDGYKVSALPFLAGAGVREPIPWTVSTGSLVYYFPELDRTVAHYRYRVNEGYFYGEADRAIESKFVPGGAIVALGQGFVSRSVSLSLASRFVLLDGDARDYHQHLLTQPPYSDYHARKVPAWFRHTRMFLSDSGATGRTLVRDRETVGRDVMSFLALIPPDDNLMVFFNHWTMQGDLPYQGTFRYYTYTDAGYSEPVPIETLKQNIAWLKALSPRIKVGGYATFTPTAGTPPYDAHTDWVCCNRDGAVEYAGDGTGLGGLPDFSSGYREYLLDQLEHYVTDLGFDWIHIDSAPFEAVNWRTKRVVQSYEVARFYDQAGKLFEQHGAALVQNVSWLASLWAHGSYMECQQPDRWEKRDWRIVAVPCALAALYRTYRPGVWSNLCYGTRGIYGIRNAQDGMKGWIRNALTWWRETPHSLAGEKIVDELLETQVSDARVTPCWWKLETDRLETEVLRHGDGIIVPVLLHGDQAEEQTLTLKPGELGLRPGDTLFTVDMRAAARPEPLDVFRPTPWQADYLELTGLRATTVPATEYTHRLKLEPLCNYYHLLTQVPAWVYTHAGERTALLLPENCGVKISGALPMGAQSYHLTIENENDRAQVLAYVPDGWSGVAVDLNGSPLPPTTMSVAGARCVLATVAKGPSSLTLAATPAAPGPDQPTAAYANPHSFVWREASHRLFYQGLVGRAYREDGMSCLALQTTTPGGSGAATFPLVAKERAGGFSLKLKGESTGGRLEVALVAGDTWSYTIEDDFTGWREFAIHREQMTAGTTRRVWEEATSLSLHVTPAAGKELSVADVRLLPAREGDLPVAGKPLTRTLSAKWTKAPPLIDGYANDPCWQDCAVASDFYKYGTEKPAEGKTTVRLCYDAGNLYMLFESLEPITSLAATHTNEFQVFTSDHAHLFLDPFRDDRRYYEIGIDTAGTIADMRHAESGWDIKWNGEYEVRTGLNYNVGWMAELRIPFSTLGRVPRSGDTWRATFARVDIAKEFSVWTTGGWDDPAGFGELVFREEGR